MLLDMLYRPPDLSQDRIASLLARLDELRGRLRHGLDRPRPWIHRLRRREQALSWSSSIAVEGFTVGPERAIELATGDSAARQATANDEDEAAFRCYADAMEHVATLAVDPHFEWSLRVILDLHFEACRFDKRARPGLLRETHIGVTADGGGFAFAGPGPERVPELIEELMVDLAAYEDALPSAVAGAMAHLNLVSIHPFSDGNGRISRILQSLVLARDGLLAPEFGSIEPYLAEQTPAYYRALQTAQRGEFDPANDTTAWVEFCLVAHVAQAERRVALVEAAAQRWGRLESIVADRGLSERLAIALEQALHGRVTRSSYAAEAGVAMPTASIDLRRLVDAGLLAQEGSGRSRGYRPTEWLRQSVRG